MRLVCCRHIQRQRAVDVLILFSRYLQRQRGSVVYFMRARFIPKQQWAVELQSLPCRHIQRQRTVDVYTLLSRHLFYRKFPSIFGYLPASTACKHQHSTFELSVYRLPR